MDYLHGLEIEVKADGDDGHFEGYAAVFDKKDRNSDIILPGAFTKSLHRHKPKKVKMFREHDPKALIGMWDEIKEDSKGLFAKGHLLLDLASAQEAYFLMKQGLLDALSIGFIAIVDAWDSKNSARVLHEIEVLEISPVSIPAQTGAAITAVKAVGPDNILTSNDLEGVLRHAGLSISTAKYICAGWTPPAKRDASGGNDDLLGSLRALTVSMKPA